jgi:hypothetical protein
MPVPAMGRREAGTMIPTNVTAASDRSERAFVVFLVAASLAWVAPSPSLAQALAAESSRSRPVTSHVARAPEQQPETNPGLKVVFEGRIVDGNGQPVAGARISLIAVRGAEPTDQGESAPDGKYRFEVPEDRFADNFGDAGQNMVVHTRTHITLLVRKAGFGVGWIEHAIKEDNKPALKPRYAHDFHLTPDLVISGHVLDPHGIPVIGAEISVANISAPRDGRWDAIVAALGVADTTPFANRHDPMHWISPMSWSVGSTIAPVTTGLDGEFRIAGLGRDQLVSLNVRGPAVVSTQFNVITRNDVDDATKVIREMFPRQRWTNGFLPNDVAFQPRNAGLVVYGPTVELEVDPARTVTGVIRDAETGSPMPGIRVSVLPESMNMRANGGDVTDSRGRYRILRSDDEGTICVVVYPSVTRGEIIHLRVARKCDEVAGLGEMIADFQLRRGVTLTGRVVEAGTDEPIASGPQAKPGSRVAQIAGTVTYRPLANNSVLRDSAEGTLFIEEPWQGNNGPSTPIHGDGTFRLLVPPGPGVLLVHCDPGVDPSYGRNGEPADENHRLFRYARLTRRAPHDSASPEAVGDEKALPGLGGPIELADFHAYRVIDPAIDSKSLDVDISVPRAPSRILRFIDPEGQPVKGITVRGLIEWPLQAVVLKGSEGEAMALDPVRPRDVLVLTNDGRYFGRARVAADETTPLTIRLEPSGSVSGRILDGDNRPVAGAMIFTRYDDLDYPRPKNSGADFECVPRPRGPVLVTNLEGRFRVSGVIPGLPISVVFQKPIEAGLPRQRRIYRPASLDRLVFQPGAALDVGELPAEFVRSNQLFAR